MDKLEELLPGIDKFLCEVLAKEQLSRLAEKKRAYYAEKIEILRLPAQPPPRPPDTQPHVPNGVVSDLFLQQQRELARTKLESTPCTQNVIEEPGIYDDVENEHIGDDPYEVPVSKTGLDEDSSGTSYESYDNDSFDDEEDGHGVYENASQRSPDIPLPRSKTKKKKGKPHKSSGANDLPIQSLQNVTWKGVMSLKVFVGWSKRHCFINDGSLMCYKNEADARPAINITLKGYQVTYFEKKDGKSYSQQLRVSNPAGSDTYYFSVDSKDLAQVWLKHLNAAALGEEVGEEEEDKHAYGNVDVVDEAAAPATCLPPVSASPVRNSTSLSLSSSEGGSGDGIVTGRNSPPPEGQEKAKTLPVAAADKNVTTKSNQKGNSLSKLLNPFNRKKAEKKRSTTLEELGIDTSEVSVAGYLDVLCTASGSRKWTGKWCIVKQGVLEVLRDTSERTVEMSITLAGCTLESASDGKRKLALKIMQGGEEKVSLDFGESMQQGKWLAILMKEIEGKGATSPGGRGSCEMSSLAEEGQDALLAEYDVVPDRSFFDSVGARLSQGLVAKSRNTTDELPPPPLPAAPPPGASEKEYENYEPMTSKEETTLQVSKTKDVPSNSSSTKSSPLMNRLRDPSSRTPDISPRGSPIMSVKDRMAKFSPKSASENTSPSKTAAAKGDEEDVVKCSSGLFTDQNKQVLQKSPTIDQDKEVLACVENPVLSKLRRSRDVTNWSDKVLSSDDELSDADKVADLKKKQSALRSKRIEMKGRRLVARTMAEKKQFDGQLAEIEKEWKQLEEEIIAAEKKADTKEKSKSKEDIKAEYLAKSQSLQSSRRSSDILSGSAAKAGTKSQSLPHNAKSVGSRDFRADSKLGATSSITRGAGRSAGTETSKVTSVSRTVGQRKATSPDSASGKDDSRHLPVGQSHNASLRSRTGNQGNGDKRKSQTAGAKVVSPTLNTMSTKVGDIGKIFEASKQTDSKTETTSSKTVTVTSSSKTTLSSKDGGVTKTNLVTVNTKTVSRSTTGSSTGTTNGTKGTHSGTVSKPAGKAPRITSVSDRLKLWESRNESKDSTC